MSTLSLDVAVSGLKAAQSQLNTISNNIANAQTAGYTRKILPQESLVVGGVGMGVSMDTLMRNVDQSLLRSLWQQVSTNQSASVTQTYLGRIQDFNGAAEDEKSISAMLGKLQNAFSTLSTSPNDPVALSQTVAAAQQVAQTFNDFSDLINEQRSSAEAQIAQDAGAANQDLAQIAKLNLQIQQLSAGGQSTADLEDQRDQAVKDLSKYIQVSTFKGTNNLMVVQTKQGQTLADTQAHQLVFNPSNPLTATDAYPASASGLFIDSTTGQEVKQGQIGGEIGALFDLRDKTLPTYQAQIDELAQKTATRFQQEGLKLFTDGSGNVPASVNPPAPTGYVGFAGEIQVNSAVVANPTLLRSGTNGEIIGVGSSEVINRITQFAFGVNAYQQAGGTVDISAGTIFADAGLSQVNKINGNQNLAAYTPDLSAAPGVTVPAQFSIDTGGGPVTITINAGDTATTLVNNINAAMGSNVASLSGGGQLILNAGSDITLGDISLGATGMASLGFNFGTFPAQNPSFSVQVGGQTPVTVSIAPGDTSTDLLATLNAIPGLSASLNGSGQLVMTPTNGGALALQNVTGTPLNALGVTVTNVPNTPFRQANLGPAANLSSGLAATGSIIDFAASAVASQAQDASRANDVSTQENTYLQTLDQRNSDTSGVNIDEEVAALTRVQSNYSAAAHMISTSEKLLDDLINSV